MDNQKMNEFNAFIERCLNGEILTTNEFLQMNKIYTDVTNSILLLSHNLDKFKKCIEIYNKNDKNKKYIYYFLQRSLFENLHIDSIDTYLKESEECINFVNEFNLENKTFKIIRKTKK